MRKFVILLLLSLFAFVLGTATSASAASPHFKKGGEPVCTVTLSGATATTVCRGALAGLGNETLVIDVITEGSAVYFCQNKGENIAPGQNKVLVGPVTEPTVIDADQIKNGNVRFVTDPNVLSAPDTVTGAEAGCPNRNWTGVNPQLTVTGVTMTIEQGGVLLFTCTASDEEGLSGTFALTC